MPNYVPRGRNVQGFDPDRHDAYDDIADGGLAEGEAFDDAFTVSKKLGPNGLSISYVDNDNQRAAYTVEWSELAALAAGQNPSDPRIGLPGWAMVRDEHGRPFPTYVWKQEAFEQRVHPYIDVQEATNAVNMGVKRGWTASDPKFPGVVARIRAITGR